MYFQQVLPTDIANKIKEAKKNEVLKFPRIGKYHWFQ
jgi:hypothetical protein